LEKSSQKQRLQSSKKKEKKKAKEFDLDYSVKTFFSKPWPSSDENDENGG